MAAPTTRPLEWEDVGTATVIRFLTATLRDEEVIDATFGELNHLVATRERVNLVVNFAGVTGIASYAIGKLITLNKRVRAAGGRIALCHLTPIIAEILDIMHLRGLFLIQPSEGEAIQALT
ncbi:MAG: STAS domain-containing protein [Gemmataceae bacterium]|nr:STAS domain-containing protein [Gemmataceae bacterium]